MKFWPYNGIVDWLLTKLFGLPMPSALPIRDFCEPGDYTWSDWHEENKKKYPIRYFLSETLTQWWRVKVSMRIDHWWYWIVSHTIRRYHKLDLRQPFTDTEDDYRWGWADERNQLVFANFNILCNYVNSINNCKYTYDYSDESLKKLEENDAHAQAEHLREVKIIYEYWTIYRKEKLKKRISLLHDWSVNKKNDHDDVRWNALKEIEKEIDAEEEKMLIRLIKIRKGLWT